MEQIPRKTTRKPYPGLGVTGILSLLAIGFFAGACSTTPGVVVNNQTALVEAQPFEGAHRTMDYQLAFACTYRKGGPGAPDRIEFYGRFVPRRGLNTFILRLHFLDAGGHVVGTQILYAPGTGQGAGRSTIDRQIEVPAGAVKMGFSHVARERQVVRRRR